MNDIIKPEGIITITKMDRDGNILDRIKFNNRLVLRYHLVITHLLSPVGNVALQSEMSPADFAKYGIPTSDDLKIRKMKFGTDGSATDITMSDIISIVEPKFNADGSAIPTGTKDWYDIDTYTFGNGPEINGVKDYDQSLTFECTMAAPQGNGNTSSDTTIYKEAGLYTANNILFARGVLPDMTKNENVAYKLSWEIKLP